MNTKPDFTFTSTDAHGNTNEYRAYMEECLLTGLNIANGGNAVNIQNNNPFKDTGHMFSYALKETDEGIMIFNGMWLEPSDDFLQAYDDYKGDIELLKDES